MSRGFAENGRFRLKNHVRFHRRHVPLEKRRTPFRWGRTPFGRGHIPFGRRDTPSPRGRTRRRRGMCLLNGGGLVRAGGGFLFRAGGLLCAVGMFHLRGGVPVGSKEHAFCPEAHSFFASGHASGTAGRITPQKVFANNLCIAIGRRAGSARTKSTSHGATLR